MHADRGGKEETHSSFPPYIRKSGKTQDARRKRKEKSGRGKRGGRAECEKEKGGERKKGGNFNLKGEKKV